MVHATHRRFYQIEASQAALNRNITVQDFDPDQCDLA
jgi:hypothetical protein